MNRHNAPIGHNNGVVSASMPNIPDYEASTARHNARLYPAPVAQIAAADQEDASKLSLAGSLVSNMSQHDKRQQQLQLGTNGADYAQPLNVMREFQQMYHDKMLELERAARGDCQSAKMNLQEDWIRDLSEQNEMLIRAVTELEYEAAERVKMLEDKLKHSAECACEVMNNYQGMFTNLDDSLQRLPLLENDLKNLLAFTRRIREDNDWNLQGLDFHTIKAEDVLGYDLSQHTQLPYSREPVDFNFNCDEDKIRKEISEREKTIKELQDQLNNVDITKSKQVQKTEKDYETLKQSMLDMRDALTVEVAEKHDIILSLRRDLQMLEEQCRKADQQTHFKDDIIKELRKELKRLKTEKFNAAAPAELKPSFIKSLGSDKSTRIVASMPVVKRVLRNNAVTFADSVTAKFAVKEKIVVADKDHGLFAHKEVLTTMVTTRDMGCNTLSRLPVQFEGLVKEESLIRNLQAEVRKLTETAGEKDLSIANQGAMVAMLVQKLITINDVVKELQLSLAKKKPCDCNSVVTESDRIRNLEVENAELRTSIDEARYELSLLGGRAEKFLGNPHDKLTQIQFSTDSDISGGIDIFGAVTLYNRDDNTDSENTETVYTEKIAIHETGYCTGVTEAATGGLENVIQQLSETVSQMMMRNTSHITNKKRIKELEDQLSEVLKHKDTDIEEERNRRAAEISNLMRTIQEQEEALGNMQHQSKSLQDTVNSYLQSITIFQEAEDKYKLEIAQQKITISNLQDALVSTKSRLCEMQQRNSQEINKLNEIITKLRSQSIEIDLQCEQYFNENINLSDLVLKLRDENLELAVESFQYIQDISLLDTSLLKYQGLLRMTEKCIEKLKLTIKQLKEEQVHQYQVIDNLRHDLGNYMVELSRLQEILQLEHLEANCELADLQQRLSNAMKTNETLVQEMNLLRSKLANVSISNKANEDRVNELQSIVVDKNVEIDRWHSAANEFKLKFDDATEKHMAMERSLNNLQRNLARSSIVAVIKDEENVACREEVDVCLGELRELKGRISLETSLYMQKMDEYQAMKTKCALQNNTIEMMKRGLNDKTVQYKEDVLQLKQQIRELNEKLNKSELKDMQSLERMKHLEESLREHVERESSLKENADVRESHLGERLAQSQNQCIRLVDTATQLEQQLTVLNEQLMVKDTELASLKEELSDHVKHASSTADNANQLKDEMNMLLQKHNKLKTENNKLRSQLSNIRSKTSDHNLKSEKVARQLDECMRQLETLQQEKEYMAARNEQLSSDVVALHEALQMKDITVADIQDELMTVRGNRDEICEQSKTMVNNVRAWLEHQQAITEQVSRKIKKLERENRILHEAVDELSTYRSNCKSGCSRMRGGASCDLGGSGTSPIPTITWSHNRHHQTGIWSLNSHGSGSPQSSLDSSQNDLSGSDQDLSRIDDNLSTPEVWLHKVESMTEEIQRSNKYWKQRLQEADNVVTHDK